MLHGISCHMVHVLVAADTLPPVMSKGVGLQMFLSEHTVAMMD